MGEPDMRLELRVTSWRALVSKLLLVSSVRGHGR